VPQLRGTLDLVFAREPRAPGESALPFQIWDGERLIPIGEYLAKNPRPELLELEARLEGLGAGPQGHRAGDVLLLARTGAERPLEQRFYFSGHYRSWHGSPTAQERWSGPVRDGCDIPDFRHSGGAPPLMGCR
jgi:hypothetical protein